MKNILLKFSLYLIGILIIQACSLWKDFTTYFNTYYNAKTIFYRIEEDILKKRTDLFAFRFDPPTTQQINELNKVIQKCSKILQFNKESSFFDDALFLTGISFYYQQEYARAQRKFLELANLPKTEFALENKIWLAKTYLQLRNFDEGINLLEEVQKTALNENEEKIFTEASIFKIAFYLFRQDYQTAVNECKYFKDNIKNQETISLVLYQMGKIYNLLGDKNNALNSFAEVEKHSPSFDIEFESKLEYARLLKDMGRIDESETSINNLLYQGKFKNQEDRILLELAQIYNEKNDFDNAINILKQIDSTYKQKFSVDFARLLLAKIYEYKIRDYDSSFKYYQKSASSTLNREIKNQAAPRIRIFDKYFSLKKTLADLNLQLTYIKDNNKFIRDSIDYDIAYNQYLEETRKKQEQSNQHNPDQSISQRLQQRGIESPQRKIQKQESDTSKYTDKNLSLVELIALGKAKKPARPKISADSITTLISQNLYNIGNLFLTEFEVPDSAIYYFNEIINNYPNKTYYVDALFALGTHYETNNQKETADSLYKIIYENYPQHKLSIEAGKKLGFIKSDDIKIVAKDPAEKFYIEAEDNYYNKKYKEAINLLRNIYLNYPRSTFAPKSILFIGMIYEELNQKDSAAFFYGILSSKEYATTPYGKAIIAKYTEYKNEKERLEKEAREKEESEKKKLEEMKIKQSEPTKPDDEKPMNLIAHPKNKIVNDSSTGKSIEQIKLNPEKKDTSKIDSSKKQINRLE